MIYLDTIDKPTPLFRLEKYLCEYEIEKNTIKREYTHSCIKLIIYELFPR